LRSELPSTLVQIEFSGESTLALTRVHTSARGSLQQWRSPTGAAIEGEAGQETKWGLPSPSNKTTSKAVMVMQSKYILNSKNNLEADYNYRRKSTEGNGS
jgi:hypothetical protein